MRISCSVTEGFTDREIRRLVERRPRQLPSSGDPGRLAPLWVEPARRTAVPSTTTFGADAGEAFAHIADMAADEIFAAGGTLVRRAVELGGFRTIFGVRLGKDAVLLGAITI